MTVTLADVERDLAQRVGPYYALTVAASPSATSVTVTELASTVTQEDKANLWLLWRAGAAADRVRQVASGPDAQGALTVDRAFGVQPAAGAAIELHALHPTTQLRAAVLLGLQKCYVESREEFTVATLDAEIDLTSHFPWLTRRKLLRSLKYRWTASASWKALPVGGFESWEADGHLWVALDYGQVLGVVGQSLLVEAFRPAFTMVNGLWAPGVPVVTDVATGGSLLADTVYNAAVAVRSVEGISPASPLATLLTAIDASNTHVARLTVPKVSGAQTYLLYLSTDAAPLRVATITEAQRLAGVTITAQDTISATSPGAGLVDVQVAGNSTAAVQTTGPTQDADVLAVELAYATAAAHTEAWRIAKERLKAAAAAGYQDSQKIAASTFTSEARGRVRRPKPRVAFRDAFAVNLDGARSA